MTRTEILDKQLSLMASGVNHARATLVALRGHAPQEVGAQVLVGENGLIAGTIGGGKLEAKVIAWVIQELSKPTRERIQLFTWNLQRDVGMTCGGEVTVLIEIEIGSEFPVVIFGAGHVAQAVTRALIPLGASITVFDTRPEWIAQLPTHAQVKARLQPDLILEIKSLRPQDYVLVMTQGHAGDLPIVTACLTHSLEKGPTRYLGMLGSPIKAQKVRRELGEAGLPPNSIASLESPMGLAIGNNRPAEIAISIVARLLQVRDHIQLTKN